MLNNNILLVIIPSSCSCPWLYFWSAVHATEGSRNQRSAERSAEVSTACRRRKTKAFSATARVRPCWRVWHHCHSAQQGSCGKYSSHQADNESQCWINTPILPLLGDIAHLLGRWFPGIVFIEPGVWSCLVMLSWLGSEAASSKAVVLLHGRPGQGHPVPHHLGILRGSPVVELEILALSHCWCS